MTTDEINRAIHERIFGRCWHELTNGVNPCTKCKYSLDFGLGCYNPDYCSDLNAMAEVEAKVIEAKGAAILANNLWMAFCKTHPERDVYTDHYVFSTPLERAEACLRAMGYWEGERWTEITEIN